MGKINGIPCGGHCRIPRRSLHSGENLRRRAQLVSLQAASGSTGLISGLDWTQQSYKFRTIPPSTEIFQQWSLHCGSSGIWLRLRGAQQSDSSCHPSFLPCLLLQVLYQHHRQTLPTLAPSSVYPSQAFLDRAFVLLILFWYPPPREPNLTHQLIHH